MASGARTWRGETLRVRRPAILGILAACLLPVTAGRGQTLPAGQPASGHSQPRTGLEPFGPADPPNPLAGPNASKLEHMREDERHKRLTSDTAKLVELTNELKEEVDKASKDQLSLDVIRKAAEIEKLAHDVKERMKS